MHINTNYDDRGVHIETGGGPGRWWAVVSGYPLGEFSGEDPDEMLNEIDWHIKAVLRERARAVRVA